MYSIVGPRLQALVVKNEQPVSHSYSGFYLIILQVTIHTSHTERISQSTFPLNKRTRKNIQAIRSQITLVISTCFPKQVVEMQFHNMSSHQKTWFYIQLATIFFSLVLLSLKMVAAISLINRQRNIFLMLQNSIFALILLLRLQAQSK